MITLNAPSVPVAAGAADSLLAFMAIMSDPKASKKYLESVKATLGEVMAKTEEMHALAKQIETDRATAEKSYAAQSDDIYKREQALAAKEQFSAEIDRRAQVLEARTDQLKAEAASLAKREREFNQAMEGLRDAQRAVALRNSDLQEAEAKLAAKEKDLAARMARLKELAG